MSVVSTEPESNDLRVARRLAGASASMFIVAIVAGLVWLWFAEPAEWEVREGGVVLTEAASRGQFSVIVVFVLVGIVTSFVWAWGVSWVLADLGWLLVPAVVVLTTVAAVVAWRVGVELGPPSPASVSDVSVGDRIPAQLEVDGLAPFLVWPIFGLAGVIGATWTRGRLRARS